jgi:hypothetical protein
MTILRCGESHSPSLFERDWIVQFECQLPIENNSLICRDYLRYSRRFHNNAFCQKMNYPCIMFFKRLHTELHLALLIIALFLLVFGLGTPYFLRWLAS